MPRLLMFNVERAARQSLELQVESLQRQNEELKKLISGTTKHSTNSILKIDAHKPTPSGELTRSTEDTETRNFLGKQRSAT